MNITIDEHDLLTATVKLSDSRQRLLGHKIRKK